MGLSTGVAIALLSGRPFYTELREGGWSSPRLGLAATLPAKLVGHVMSLLAQSGHPDTLNQCPLSGVKRIFSQLTSMSAFDPERT